ncbi:chromate transporter [Blautia liquoris]|uniref:Chromate transporter n=1 Tax=Blautia liquoris TaxID=2779518 RepID=A0A7M2RH25_9FIRM|nr:chromate transporter [Blautia liquoris]QOV19633.1 chromate transporter [Blautia liquoris]
MLILELFLRFFKLGFMSFGGGYAIVPLLYEEVSGIWDVTKTQFANLIGLFELTPGSVTVNAAGYVGYQIGKIPGAVLSTIGVILPSFILMLIISSLLKRFSENELTNEVIRGVRPAAMGIMCSSLIFFIGTSIMEAGNMPKSISDPLVISIPSLSIAALSFYAVHKKNINPIWVTLGAGALGVLLVK